MTIKINNARITQTGHDGEGAVSFTAGKTHLVSCHSQRYEPHGPRVHSHNITGITVLPSEHFDATDQRAAFWHLKLVMEHDDGSETTLDLYADEAGVFDPLTAALPQPEPTP